MSVEIGLNATSTRTSSPFVIPPSRPPARLRVRMKRPRSTVIGSCTALPCSRAATKASANCTPFADWIDMSACAMRPSRRLSHCADDPSPATRPLTRSATIPPSVSPASRAFAIAATIRSEAARSAERTSLDSTAAASKVGVDSTSPIARVSLRTSMPTRRKTTFATAPAATRAAVSRALERSMTSRTSSCANLSAPARSACPGRRRVTAGGGSGTGSTLMTRSQFTASRLGMTSATGAPVVRPCRTPPTIDTASRSMRCRAPRP